MHEPKPPRRDPRVLAIVPDGRALTYAAIDAWELRGIGRMRGDHADLRLGLARLLVQTRPTVVVATPSMSHDRRAMIEGVARHRGVPVVFLGTGEVGALLRDAPGRRTIEKQYPVLRAFDRNLTAATVPIAIAALTHLDFPPRRYASRIPATSPPRLACNRSHRHRAP